MTKRALALLLAVLPLPAGAELGLNLYGLSYHFDRSRARELGIDNELNAGVGLRYRVWPRERLQLILDAGAYHDSGRNTAALAGAGLLWTVAGGWRVGGAVALFDSDTYNGGRAFVAPLPLAAYEWRSATLNVTFFPRIAEVNEVATLGAWVTWWWR